MDDGDGGRVQSAWDRLAGDGGEGFVPFPEGGKGLRSVREGGPRGSMQSNEISPLAVSESYYSVGPLASQPGCSCHPSPGDSHQQHPTPTLGQAGTLCPSQAFLL